MSIGPPENVTYARTTGTLSWSAVAGADRYLVMEKTQLQMRRQLLASVAGTSHSVGIVATGEVRAWTVIPFSDQTGRGIPSRPTRTSGTKRKLAEQDEVLGTGLLFEDGTGWLLDDDLGALKEL